MQGGHEIVAQAKANITAYTLTAKRQTSTGRLRNSIDILGYSSYLDDMYVDVGSNVPYAAYQEYGFTARNGKVVPPRFFLTNAVIDVLPEIPRYIEQRLPKE